MTEVDSLLSEFILDDLDQTSAPHGHLFDHPDGHPADRLRSQTAPMMLNGGLGLGSLSAPQQPTAVSNQAFLSSMVNNPGLLLQQPAMQTAPAQPNFFMNSLQQPTAVSSAPFAHQIPGLHGLQHSLNPAVSSVSGGVDTNNIMTIL
ncbi:hypothetical protein M3Y99_00343200 [Aphelenchoides fujianensis]|nr:hypothetical protein M3Y99_00343200 [Aphelenchoides fujianensis]